MKNPLKFLLILFIGFCLFACKPDPQIISIGPKQGLPGTIVEIRGNNFNPDPFSNQVKIGNSVARVLSGDAQTIR